VLFRVNVRDTQTGLKLIRREVLVAALPRMLEKRYAFDLELLVVARLLGYTRVFEAPVQIDYRFSSQVDLKAATRILLDTLAIFYRRFLLDTYRRAPGSLPQGEAFLAEMSSTAHLVGLPSLEREEEALSGGYGRPANRSSQKGRASGTRISFKAGRFVR
jgi:hypothetical protein